MTSYRIGVYCIGEAIARAYLTTGRYGIPEALEFAEVFPVWLYVKWICIFARLFGYSRNDREISYFANNAGLPGLAPYQDHEELDMLTMLIPMRLMAVTAVSASKSSGHQ